GVLSGGLVTTLLDHVGGLAVWIALGRFESIATLDLRVDYMRAAGARRDLVAEARCYHLTRSVAFVRAWAFEDGPDDPVAAAQSAYMLSSMRSRGLGSNLKRDPVDGQ
ncbi:MAG: PaaI family thioesterase, partial [Pseudomonadota bacterium]|nr:PaaI family thioesterase [Pseudomonadota bacterium]